MPRYRDPVQKALQAIQAEINHVLDHSEGTAPQRRLADALVEMGVGLGAPRPSRPPMSLADLAGRPEPEAQPTPEPEQLPPSAAVELLNKGL